LNALKSFIQKIFVIIFINFSLQGISQEEKLRAKIDSTILSINNSELEIRKSLISDPIYSTTYFREDYYLDKNNKIAKVTNQQGENLTKVTTYYFFNDKLIKVTSEILNADSSLYRNNYYFDNGKSLKIQKKQRDAVSYFIGKAEDILKTIYNK
jgi:hypothetical protein